MSEIGLKQGKRYIALLLVCMLFLFMSCTGILDGDTSSVISNEAETEETAKDSYSLPYRNTSPINPIVTDSASNLALAGLIYEGLVRMDDDFKPENLLAEEIKPNTQNTAFTVILKKGISFSDGSPLTIQDVQDTIRAIQNTHSSPYYTRLSNVGTAEITGVDTMEITLKNPDPYFISLLDFPVVQKGSLEHQNVLGTGRYVCDKNELLANDHWHGGEIATRKINLIHFSDIEAIRHSLEIGNINFLYTESNDKPISAVSMKEVPMNQLAFIAFNQQSALLKQAAVRSAISAAIDRDGLLSRTQGYAHSTGLPFHPGWYVLKEAEAGIQTPVSGGLEGAMAELGYTEKDEDGIFIKTEGKKSSQFSLRMIYPKAEEEREAQAEFLAEQLTGLGILIELVPLDTGEFNQSVSGGRYDLCFSEIRLTMNADISPLVQKTGLFSKTLDSDGMTDSVYGRFLAGDINFSEYCREFQKQAPIAPLFFRSAKAMHSRNFSANIEVIPGMIYKNAESWVLYE